MSNKKNKNNSENSHPYQINWTMPSEEIKHINYGGTYGWICPLCGKSLSPWTFSCPCSNKNEVTC